MKESQDWFARWHDVWQSVAISRGDELFGDLVERYAEPHRAYHTMGHIGDCLLHVDSVWHLLLRPVEVELAIWFHDAIYDPHRGDNEEQSALLALEQLKAGKVDEAVLARIGELIRLTTHMHDHLQGDGAFLCDIDLAILGADPEQFDRYNIAIRHEYDWVPEGIYRMERSRVLNRFLSRPQIYHTRFFFDRLERKARKNLARATG